MSKKHTVFVYGSLLKGMGNHSVLGSAEFVGSGSITGYLMYSLGGFPAIKQDPDTNLKPIRGEVYKVDDEGLRRLDSLEGYSRSGNDYGYNMYEPEVVSVEMDTGKGVSWTVACEVYTMTHDSTRLDRNPVVGCGHWPTYYDS